MKILEEIKRDHDKVRELFLQIENKEDEGPEIFNTLAAVILAHYEAEEKAVFGKLPDDKESRELKLELIAEHDSLRRAMQVVLDTDPGNDNWKARLMVCKEVFSHHMEEEEKELFETLRKELTETQLNKLFDTFIAAEQKSREAAEGLVKKGMILHPEDYLPKGAGNASQKDSKKSAAKKPAAKKPAAKKPGSSK